MIAGLLTAMLLAAGGQLTPSPEPGLREAVRRVPDSFEANHQLGEFLLHRNRIKEAIPFLEAAHRADASHEINTYDLGLAYLRAGAVDQARSHIRAAFALKETASWRNLEGAIEARRDNVAGAAEAFRRAAELDPTEPHLFDLGDHFLRYRGYADAVKIFEFGLDRYPRSARLHVGLGIARYSLGDYDAAVDSLCTAVDLDPSDPRPLTFLGALHDVSPALAGEVGRRLEGFVKLHPRSAQAHYFYALSLWKRFSTQSTSTDLKAAEKHLRTALALDPKLASAHLQLGVLLEDAGRSGEAIDSYTRAVQLDQSLGKAHYRLSQLHARAGNAAASRRHLAIFRRLEGQSAEAAK